ncbi:serine carboxypeptidase-like 48 [Glycine soja]|uniref:serine carboxypeptidase-like 48 n=1 Tax=Glycine max TaxID=3847 RepID=UPI0003DE8111|nr:serine carboxypeptidase-like 48 [Glycine max]XP_028242251.1 serine carboxypeptidase-like 48 [Glycine soja]|eukprot:XP_006584358.1 serine carboxypeptidase-like 48 [Glycine max]
MYGGLGEHHTMFYFFFESQSSKNDCVVISLTRGPRCSNELGLFCSNGPFQLTKNLSLEWNDYGWDKRAGAPTIPTPASTLAPFYLEDHQVLSSVDSGLESAFALADVVEAYTDVLYPYSAQDLLIDSKA